MELYAIEKLERELSELYAAMENTSDTEEIKNIQHCIQQRNLQLVRIMPNE